uniref:Uncharacterized protein n=1 Tax=Rhipicephalus zambeziensis TaxID=60191 RepID=A0A224YC28_9ACAR
MHLISRCIQNLLQQNYLIPTVSVPRIQQNNFQDFFFIISFTSWQRNHSRFSTVSPAKYRNFKMSQLCRVKTGAPLQQYSVTPCTSLTFSAFALQRKCIQLSNHFIS